MDDNSVLDTLTPTQELILEVLCARHRLGEPFWPLSTKLTPAITGLQKLDLVYFTDGPTGKMLNVGLTGTARNALALTAPGSRADDTEPAPREYIPPANRAYADRIAGYLKRVGAEKMAYSAVSRLFGTDR